MEHQNEKRFVKSIIANNDKTFDEKYFYYETEEELLFTFKRIFMLFIIDVNMNVYKLAEEGEITNSDCINSVIKYNDKTLKFDKMKNAKECLIEMVKTFGYSNGIYSMHFSDIECFGCGTIYY